MAPTDDEKQAQGAGGVAPAAAAAACPPLQCVVACARDGGIGNEGGLPWASLPGDMAYFKALTSATHDAGRQNAVLMGRRTWESIPARFRPLKGRLNIVLSRSLAPEQAPGATVCGSLAQACELLASPAMQERVESCFVIGGGQVYKEVLASPHCAAIHLTRVEADLPCDTHFPTIDPARFRLWSASEPQGEEGMRYSFLCYTTTDGRQPIESPSSSSSSTSSSSGGASSSKEGPAAASTGGSELLLPRSMASRHDELQYLELVADIIKRGVFRPDRTGTGTYSRFGCSMRFNLRHTFPLLTTKRTFWRGVAEELLWFVAGSTNANLLRDKNIHIWDGNSSREYLDSIGLTHREEGDLGPVYGFQWRHFGAQYSDMHSDYTGQGVDQLADIIARIKTNPCDRRLLLTAWNPAALKDMALPPCHMFCQFFVAHGELSCLMYQRSCDIGLGVPFNIASYALLTRLVAQVCGLRAGDFVHMMGDTHVYANHVQPLKEQLRNAPRHFPTLRINPAKTDIDSFSMEDFELLDYNPHKKIEMKMAV